MDLDLTYLDLFNFQGKGPENLNTVPLIGLYFAAHWFPACRSFTPQLTAAYKMINSSSQRLEIIYVSFDRDQESFEEYSESMPWLMIPFTKSEARFNLAKKFKIENTFKLIILAANSRVIATNAIEEFKAKGMQIFDIWLKVSKSIEASESFPLCEKGHSMTEVLNPDKIQCSYCKSQLLAGWTCAECDENLCQLCQEWLLSSDVIESRALKCFKSHQLRKTEEIQEYYMKRFFTQKYTCRTCNKYPNGKGFHCRFCIFDVCEDCGEVIQNHVTQKKCQKGHELSWNHEVCLKIQQKYSVCSFRCEECKESYMGGGNFACADCEYYNCVPCISKYK